MQYQLNILVLHNLGDPHRAPFFLSNQVFFLQKYHPENNYLFHDITLPIPEYVKDAEFDLILLDVTFLWKRWSPQSDIDKLKSDYEFVRDSNAVKVAFPQDEYDCSQILDEWMVEWNVDIVYSVISDNWDILYPKYHKVGSIKLAYTGYIDQVLIDWPKKTFDLRTVDIGYRAKKLLPYFGRIGEIKSTIALEVLAKTATNQNLNADIEIGDKGTLHGKAWFEFINNSKFTLGSNSGSSLLDPLGKIQQKVKLFLLQNQGADFEKVEKYCFPEEDGRYEFTAISPRVMEAALLNSCQILVQGKYSGLVEPWENYIPIKADASDWDEVYLAMQDHTLVQKMINNTRSKILDTKELRAQEKSQKILSDVSVFLAKKKVYSSPELVCKVIYKYNLDMSQGAYKRAWLKRRLKKHLISSLENYPSIEILLRKINNKFH